MKKLFNILLICMFLLPQVNTSYTFILFIFFTILYFRYNYFFFSRLKSIVFYVFILSFIFIDPGVHHALDAKEILKPFIILLIILSLGSYKGFEVDWRIILLISGCLIFSQLVYVFGISGITQYLDGIYPINEEQMVWTHRSVSSINELFGVNIRGGGLYRNPNQYTKYLNLLYVLVLNIRFKSKLKYILPVVFLVSILLTGSRTGLIVFIFLNLLQYVPGKRSIVSPILLGAILLVVISNFELRSIEFTSAISSGSLTKRIPSIVYIIDQLNVKSLFIGNFYNEDTVSDLLNFNFMFDSDLLSVFFSFGFVGLLVLVMIYHKLIKFNKVKYVSPIFLYSITGGIVFDLNFFVLLNSILLLAKFKNKR